MSEQYIVGYSDRLAVNHRGQLVIGTDTSWEGSSRYGGSVKRHLRQKEGAENAVQKLLVRRRQKGGLSTAHFQSRSSPWLTRWPWTPRSPSPRRHAQDPWESTAAVSSWSSMIDRQPLHSLVV